MCLSDAVEHVLLELVREPTERLCLGLDESVSGVLVSVDCILSAQVEEAGILLGSITTKDILGILKELSLGLLGLCIVDLILDALADRVHGLAGAHDRFAHLLLLLRGRVDQFGEDRVKELQKLHPGLYRNEGGGDPEMAAEILGYNSADEMMRNLEASPRRSQAIEDATRQYMTEKHGDIRYDGSLKDEAIDDTMRFAMVQPAIKDALSIMRDRSFSDTLGMKDPAVMESMLVPWLNRAARQITSEPGKFRPVDMFWNWVRKGVGTSTMFGNLANAMVHIPNLFFSKLQVKDGLGSSLAHYMGSPRQMTNDIIDKSEFMKSRLDLQTRKMQQSIDNILSNRGPVGKTQNWFEDHGYFTSFSTRSGTCPISLLGMRHSTTR